MDWKQEARKDLQNYQRRKTALENMKQMVCLLQDDYFALRTGSFDTAPVMGKGSGSEEWMLNNIVKRERLQHNINATQAWISFIENGLRCLTDQQRDILTQFYIDRKPGMLERLMERYHMEKSRVYEQKDQALYDFTVLTYGLIDY